MAHPIKWFHSGMAGAPVLNGAAGALISVLDACLVNGINLITLDSLVISGGVLTGIKAGHGFVVDQVIKTAGAAQSVLNGEWRITTATSNTFSASAVGIADTVGSGPLSAKAAPAGWDKPFSVSNKAAYRSLAPESCGFFLRIDDSNAEYSRVLGYESMTDIDTGGNSFPTSAQVAGGAYWRKSYGGAATVRDWLIIADDQAFYIVVNSLGGVAGTIDVFGDFPSYKAGDGYACMLSGQESIPNSSPTSAIGWGNGGTPYGALIWLARSYSQLGSSVKGSTASMVGWGGNSVSGISNGNLAYPSPVDNGLILVDPVLMEGNDGSTNVIRGSLPGMFYTPQRVPLEHLDRLTGVNGISDRTLLMIAIYTIYILPGRVAVDITGPWR